MAPSASNSSSPRRSSQPSAARRASTGPRTPPTQPNSPSASQAPAGYGFTSQNSMQIKRTVNITVEISSGTAPASHMDVSQYHMPVTTSCYSPTSSSSYEYQASEYETTSSYYSQGASPTPSLTTASSSSHEPTQANGTQGSTYGNALEPSEYYSTSSQQHGQYPSGCPSSQEPSYTFSSTSSFFSPPVRSDDYSGIVRYADTNLGPLKRGTPQHAFSTIQSARVSMLERFLTVDPREDALVVEARAAIREGRVMDGNNELNGWGWEMIIDNL